MPRRKQSQYSPGEHPNSLANLIREGRPTAYDEKKKRREVTITDTGWQGFKALAKEMGYSSASEFIEQMGRGQVEPSKAS